MPDAIFAHPRLAAVYDALDDDRSDLDVYVALVDELGAQRVLDLGCGTGTFACMLAARGKDVIGVDPAVASLDVARRKPDAGRVRWVEGHAGSLPSASVDLVTMTANVAQVFVTDEEWADALAGVHEVLRPGGSLVFEAREPSQRAWERWTRDASGRTVDIPGVGAVETWVELTDVQPPFVSFRHTVVFSRDATTLTSDSTLRFRSRGELTDSLVEARFVVREVRDAPDRPGLEMVFVAERGEPAGR